MCPTPGKAKNNKMPVTILLACFVILVTLYFAVNSLIEKKDQAVTPDMEYGEKLPEPSTDPPATKPEQPDQGQDLIVEQLPPLLPTLIAQHTTPGPDNTAAICKEVYEGLDKLYNHLDRQDDLKGRLNKGARAHLEPLAGKIMQNPPIVVRETDNLMSILQNAAHFFRIFGASDLRLVKDIVVSEEDRLESAMALFYHRTLLNEKCRVPVGHVRVEIKPLYEYACFFLNTLGGQSYLYRRSHTVRTLIKYYSVLIIDRANEAMLNQHGLDIRPPLYSLMADLQITQNLRFRDQYLENLSSIAARYPAP